jgi:hypothetical protein
MAKSERLGWGVAILGLGGCLGLLRGCIGFGWALCRVGAVAGLAMCVCGGVCGNKVGVGI